MTVRILKGDCRQILRELPDESVHCVVTSPPYYGLRDYGVAGQIGLELTPDAFVSEMVAVFGEVRRVLRNDGTLWLNLGDSYAATNGSDAERTRSSLGGSKETQAIARSAGVPINLKPKDLIGIPWRVAFALQADGWYLRQDIIWSKPNPMPESVRDRCTKAHEYIFMLSRSRTYYYDAAAIREPNSEGSVARLASGPVQAFARGPKKAISRGDGNSEPYAVLSGRNKRSVWEVATSPFPGAHFATFPPDLIEPCIKAGCPAGGTVLDPFGGAGTTGMVADRFGRNAILIELNPEYAAIAERRIHADAGMFAEVSP